MSHYIWSCGHKTAKSYKTYPMCPVCAVEQGKYAAMIAQIEAIRDQDNERNRREGIAWSKIFNRQGCPYCGGIT